VRYVGQARGLLWLPLCTPLAATGGPAAEECAGLQMACETGYGNWNALLVSVRRRYSADTGLTSTLELLHGWRSASSAVLHAD